MTTLQNVNLSFQKQTTVYVIIIITFNHICVRVSQYSAVAHNETRQEKNITLATKRKRERELAIMIIIINFITFHVFKVLQVLLVVIVVVVVVRYISFHQKNIFTLRKSTNVIL